MTLSSSVDARTRAGARWTAFADRLRTISPQSLARAGIATVVVVAATWLAAASWPALAPFVAGLVIAYAVLPLANRLDRFMPRVLAALIAELVALAVLVGVLVIVVPPVLRGLVEVALRLPNGDEIRAQLAGLQAQVGELPEPLRSVVVAVTTQSVANFQAILNGFVDKAAAVVTSQILGIFSTLSFVLGLLVIPAWVLTVVADQQSIRRRAAGMLPVAVRTDVLAIVSIVDRAFGTFLRVRMLLAIVTGVLVFAGVELTNAAGLTEVRFTATAGTLLGFLQLIPELGFFLGVFPILLLIPIQGPVGALAVFGIYWASVRLAGMLVETRVSRGVLDVHPALLIPAIVVLSQFGLIWLIAAAPVVAITRDLIRYVYGRLGDPAEPAGLLPGERRRRRTLVTEAGTAIPVPSVYRGGTRALPGTTPPGTPLPAPPLAAAPRPRPAFGPATVTAGTMLAGGVSAASGNGSPDSARPPA